MSATLNGPSQVGGHVECQHRHSMWDAHGKSKSVEKYRVERVEELLVVRIDLRSFLGFEQRFLNVGLSIESSFEALPLR